MKRLEAAREEARLEVSEALLYDGAQLSLGTIPGGHYTVSLYLDLGSTSGVGLAVYAENPYGPVAGSPVWTSGGTKSFSFTATTSLTRLKVYKASQPTHTDYFIDNVTVVMSQDLAQEGYRFGFNGKEKDDEVYGAIGTSYDYGFRMHDPRVGRFLSLDPLASLYPFYTPYQFAGNSPILFIDLDGLERKRYHRNDGKTKIVLKSALDIYTEKHGKVDIYNPRSSYGNKHKGDATGWGFGQQFDPAAGDPANFTFKAADIDNPLERHSSRGEDRSVNGRVDITPMYPEGNVKMEFNPGVDEKGKPKSGTFEMGVVDGDGTEHTLVKTTSNEPGEINANFKLGEGERLYQRTSNPGMGGSTETSATRIPTPQPQPSNTSEPSDD